MKINFAKPSKKTGGILRFGGLQKSSLIDYPGKVSCVVFVSGCNFHCPYCHNPELLDSSLDLYSDSEILSFLNKRRKLLDAVVVSGGEPTLQKGLLPFCEKIKSMGYDVKLDTNGSKPEVLKKLIKTGLVDYFAMDLKTLPDQYNPVLSNSVAPEAIFESIGLIMESNSEYEFRTTCVKPLVDETILRDLAQLISGADLFILQAFREKGILAPDFFREVKNQFTRNELREFKNILEEQVRKCIVR